MSFALAKVLRFLGIDRAVAYTLMYRVWQLFANAAVLFLIARSLTRIEQGFHYLFFSVVSLQIFFELGLTYVLMQFASHESARLAWTARGTLEGNPTAEARLALLLRFAGLWYGVVALILVAVLLPAGIAVFGRSADAAQATHWQASWAGLVVGTAAMLFISLAMAVLEGSGRVAEVARVRVVQDIIAYCFFGLALFLGARLLAAPLLPLTRAVVSFSWLAWTKRNFFLHLINTEADRRLLNWRREVWPMQWKIALSWISGYFTFTIFTPILFAFAGAAAAGQMGMSLSISGAVTTLAMAWVQTKAPLFGQLIARQQFAELDKRFFRVFSQVAGIAASMSLAIWIGVVVLRSQGVQLSERFLGPLPLGLLLLAGITQVVTYAFAVYLRAHKTEPLLACSISVALLTTISTYVLGRSFGATGIAGGYLFVTATAGTMWATLVFFSKRRTWHVTAEPTVNLMQTRPELQS
jgi:hypothetical protein